MRARAIKLMLGIGVMVASLSLYAQGVYVTRGANGPVFSDKPQPGAKEMRLKPLNVVPAQKVPQEKTASGTSAGTLQERAGKQAVPEDTPYRTFSILSPEQDGSVVANTGSPPGRRGAPPPLRLGEGHAFGISLNGQPVGQRFTATEFMFPPEFWGGVPPINQRAQLDVSIVDSAGRVGKFLSLGRAFPTQNGIAVRITAEAVDDGFVQQFEIRRRFGSVTFEECGGLGVDGAAFAVHQRHQYEMPLFFFHGGESGQADGFLREADGGQILREGGRAVAEQVA